MGSGESLKLFQQLAMEIYHLSHQAVGNWRCIDIFRDRVHVYVHSDHI
ncbi:MAG: hypothetical protein RBS85_04150 [Methanofastidiosum sp.]|nr:hypothetical protein [Methanofastidiosum sp.]